MTLPLGRCETCGVKLKNFGEAYPGAHSKGRRLVPLRMRRHWCLKCWMKFSWYKSRGYPKLFK